VAILGQHVVQGGETLNCIGRGYGVLPSAIAQVNGLTTASSLTVGQTLAIPDVQWVDISIGPVCAPQFKSKYPGLPVTTVTPAATTPAPVATTPSPTSTTPATGGTPGLNHMGTEKVVIADYVMWYSPQDLGGSISWDSPSAGPYQSDDFGTLQRHVAEAQRACLNGFSAHWYGPGDQRTTNNFNQLLKASAGTGLRHAILILTNILPGVTEQDIINAVNYVKDNWAQGPNYLRLGGRPVLIFTDMPRPWGDDASALAGWTRIRAAADPNHSMIWMAEGLTTTYNPLFDGLYVYRIDHADFPQSWLKQPRWATSLRAVEQQGNLPLGGLYFADTIAPGFDDTRAANAGSDLRAPAPPFSRDRRDGGYYADTYSVIPQTGGDFLFVKSYNEWIEGTEIEPGRTYGDLYLNLTCQYAKDYRSR
jgi:LysM repeat protein